MKHYKIKKNTPSKFVYILGIKGNLEKPKLPLRVFWNIPKYFAYEDKVIFS